MNAITKTEPKLMLLASMAEQYLLNPEEFSKTVRATCGLATASAEQFAAFLIVAKTYGLNPITREIYAFPGRGGGIVPIVSIDGWVNLVNSHPQCDGFDFQDGYGEDGELDSYTCTMHRKDRKHPTAVTEYLSECVRATEPWKMKHRMLRHKSLIQAARYAFGFAGIYDEDEGRVIAEGGPDTVPTGPKDSGPPRAVKVIEHKPDEVRTLPAGTVIKETGSHLSGDPVDDIPEDQQTKSVEKPTAPEPRDLVPEPGKTNSFEGWATAYILMIETSPDKATMFKWIDANHARLKTLEKSPEWTAKVKKATVAVAKRLDKDNDPISSGPAEPQGSLLGDMGEDAAPKPAGRTSKAPKAGKIPSVTKDYDGFIAGVLKALAEVTDPAVIEAIWDETVDPAWSDLMPPDKDQLQGARREAEGRLEQ